MPGEYRKSFLKNKNKKLIKRSKLITRQSKNIENSYIVDIISVTIEHPKTFHKLSKTIRQANKVCQVGDAGKNFTSPLYRETTKK